MDGTAEGVVDGNRVQLPARFREAWGAQPLVVSRGPNRCLYVHTVAGYERLISVILSSAPGSGVRTLRRFLTSSAMELNPDVRGRLRISRPLMQYAGIENRVVWRAEGEQLEVWDKAELDSWMASGNRHSMLASG